MILDETAAVASWETAPAPAREVVTSVWARAGRMGRADLILPGGTLEVDLGTPGVWTGDAGEARFLSTGEDQGWYVIKTRAQPGEALKLTARPRQEMSFRPDFFLPELRAEVPALPSEWAGRPHVPRVRIHEAKAEYWRPAKIF